jgi:hypothetical protein
MFLDFHRTSKGAFFISADVEGSCGESTHTRVGRRNRTYCHRATSLLYRSRPVVGSTI